MYFSARSLWGRELLALLFIGLVASGLAARAQEPRTAEGEVATSSLPVVLPDGTVPRLVRFSGTVKLPERQTPTAEAEAKPRPRAVAITFALYKEQEGGVALGKRPRR